MRYPKLRELKEAVRSLISKPYTSKFPHEPHVPFEGYRGKPKYYEEGCVGCGACAQVCPSKAIEIKDDVNKDSPKRKLVLDYGICIMCGQCQRACITQEGIKLSSEFDLAFFNRAEALETVEKDLILCQVCGDVVAPLDHLVWIARKVGPAAYSNPTLFLPYLKGVGIIDEDLPGIISQVCAEGGNRQDRTKVVCTACRRKTTLST